MALSSLKSGVTGKAIVDDSQTRSSLIDLSDLKLWMIMLVPRPLTKNGTPSLLSNNFSSPHYIIM